MKHKAWIIAGMAGFVLFLIWFGGFLLFNRTVFRYNNTNHIEQNADGIAALTGGRNRIRRAVEMLNDGIGRRLLISGVKPGTTQRQIAEREDVDIETALPIDLGYQATDTVGNAREISHWARRFRLQSLYIVTSFYHIPRSRLELEHEMPEMMFGYVAADSGHISQQWWRNIGSFRFLAAEYTKFLIVYGQYYLLGR